MIPCISLNLCQGIQRQGIAFHHPVRNLLAAQYYRVRAHEEARSRGGQWKGFPRLLLRDGFFSRLRFHLFVYPWLYRRHHRFLPLNLTLAFQSFGNY